MVSTRYRIQAVLLLFLCLLSNVTLASENQEDWDEARKASCAELIDAYKTTVGLEQKVLAAIKESNNGTIATNVLGVASLTVLGVGFFTWDNNESAEENLADLRADKNILVKVAAEKQCVLPSQ